MEKIKINLNKVEDVKRFVKVASTYESDINVYKDHYIIDGKSLLGVLSLDLSQLLDVELLSDNPVEVNTFKLDMAKFQ